MYFDVLLITFDLLRPLIFSFKARSICVNCMYTVVLDETCNKKFQMVNLKNVRLTNASVGHVIHVQKATWV